ncbi:MAG: hypothetical protein FJW23_01455 [Acidimicrobiia bacterium]|nr:hypothetical protein [Acidimicrobiia bacterium]
MRQRVLLGVLVVLLGVAGVRYFRGDDAATAVAPTAAVASTGAPVNTVPSALQDGLRLGRLGEAREALEPAARNPFRFEARATPRKDVPDLEPPPAPRPPPPVSSGLPPPPSVPPIPLKFIGLVEGAGTGGRLAVLADGSGNVFHGKEGDIIDGRYRLVRVGADTAELTHADGHGRQVLRLTGQ